VSGWTWGRVVIPKIVVASIFAKNVEGFGVIKKESEIEKGGGIEERRRSFSPFCFPGLFRWVLNKKSK